MTLGSKNGSHMVDLLFTLALFCVFAASALLVVLIGASVYKGTVEQMDQSFNNRTSMTYVSTKIKQNDVAGGVFMGDLDGTPALILEQQGDTNTYQTWIYYHDGALREIFIRKDGERALGDGQLIAEVTDFLIEQDGNSILIASTDKNGVVITQRITVRCGIDPGKGVPA